MRPPIRILMLAVLVAIVATLLAPATPAHAVDCIEEFVIDPTLCDEPPPQPLPHPPPTPPARTIVTEEVGRSLERLPSGPNEVCERFTLSTGTSLDTAGQRRALYAFAASVSYCITKDIGGVDVITKPMLSSRNQQASATDPTVSITPTRTALVTGDGTSRVLAVSEMFFRFCEGFDDCQNFRHFIQFIVDPNGIAPTSKIDLFFAPLPIFT